LGCLYSLPIETKLELGATAAGILLALLGRTQDAQAAIALAERIGRRATPTPEREDHRSPGGDG